MNVRQKRNPATPSFPHKNSNYLTKNPSQLQLEQEDLTYIIRALLWPLIVTIIHLQTHVCTILTCLKYNLALIRSLLRKVYNQERTFDCSNNGHMVYESSEPLRAIIFFEKVEGPVGISK